jgi:NitT/TauT family transport system substrate-binding protein
MVMDLVESGVDAKIVSLGHRSGAVIMVRKDSPAKSFRDLRGRRIAIPSRFAVDHLFVRRMLKESGMSVRDVELVEMAPPEMPAALTRTGSTPARPGSRSGRWRRWRYTRGPST